jgi:hypothetical protein
VAARIVQNAARCWRQTSQVIPLSRGRRLASVVVVAFKVPSVVPFMVPFLPSLVEPVEVLVELRVKVLMPPPPRCRTPGRGPGRWG